MAGRTDGTGSPRRQPAPATPERLQKAAFAYLQRYASSTENLRRVLLRRVTRSARLHGTDAAAGAQAVDGIVARCAELGLLDDRVYAEGLARGQRRRGSSARLLRARLADKGVAPETAASVMEATEPDPEAAEWRAAIAYARRRRLGPFALQDRGSRRERDLAALFRAGFPIDMARRIVDAADPDALDEL